MIVFDLSCKCGYQFEGWFNNHDDFTAQKEGGLLACPVCKGPDIHKILSPVRSCLGASPSSENRSRPENFDEKTALAFLNGLGSYVKKNFEDVGAKLAEEALKIHYGVSQARNIRGVATEQEEKDLKDEGIDLVKIPLPPEDDSTQ